MHKVLYFIGAGLSKALECQGTRIPLMYDFIPVLADYIETDSHHVILTTLIELENAQLYDWDSPEALELAKDLEKEVNSNPATPSADKIERFKRALKNRPSESIEKLLERSVSTPGLEAETARDRFRYAINRLFCRVHWNVNWQPLKSFLKRQLDDAQTAHTFISFNYDLLLDSAVQKVSGGEWNVAAGYGFSIRNMVDAQSSGGNVSPLNVGGYSGRIRILKPNGSLNWLAPYRRGYRLTASGMGFRSRPVVAPLTNRGELEYWHPTEDFNRLLLGGSWLDVSPCIVPPTFSKSSNLQFLRRVRKQEVEELRRANEIYVIGWSMPQTDTDQEALVRHAVKNRSEPIEKITVVNQGAPPEYFHRVAEVFGVCPQQLKIFNSGFCHFVDPN